MAKSQQTFNKLEREKNKAKKREEKRKKMQARKEAREKGELKQDEFVYVDHLGNFTDPPPDPAEKEEISFMRECEIARACDNLPPLKRRKQWNG